MNENSAVWTDGHTVWMQVGGLDTEPQIIYKSEKGATVRAVRWLVGGKLALFIDYGTHDVWHVQDRAARIATEGRR